MKKTLAAWNSDHFAATFKQEVRGLSVDELLLQKALTVGSYATTDNLKVMINRKQEMPDAYIVNAGIFFTSMIGGCNCADDPTPQDSYAEYCELRFNIDKSQARTSITLKS